MAQKNLSLFGFGGYKINVEFFYFREREQVSGGRGRDSPAGSPLSMESNAERPSTIPS